MASIRRIGKDRDGRVVWDVLYRRTPGGRQIHRRLRGHSKADIERQIALDSNRSDVDIRWSEGLKLYVEAKHQEGRNPDGIGHAERAVAVFSEVIGDIPIESTTPDTLKHFMQLVAKGVTVHNTVGEAYQTAGPNVANHHRKELITVARYLQRHAGKVKDIPFLNVPPLPLKVKRRSPIHESRIHEYLDALAPHVLRPVNLVLYYGLRSSAICNIMPESVQGRELVVVDKGNVEHRIPIDDMLGGIIEEALAYRAAFANPSPRLFVNTKGRAWNRTSLLLAAQRYWKAAGLEKKKIHEVRHTLGTVAGKMFAPGMVQAVMRHRSRRSSETYFHPDEDMASEGRQKIVTVLSQKRGKGGENSPSQAMAVLDKDDTITCPCCDSKVLIIKEKGHKP